VILQTRAQRDPRYLDEHDWFTALSLRGAAYAARTLLTLISEGAFEGRKQNADPLSLARRLALGVAEDKTIRREIYEQYERGPSGPVGRVLEYAIAEAPDDEGILLLVHAYAAQRRNELGALEQAIRHLAIGEQPSETMSGAVEQFSVDVADLRRRLF